jgi:hypothetical protein
VQSVRENAEGSIVFAIKSAEFFAEHALEFELGHGTSDQAFPGCLFFQLLATYTV